MKESKTETIIAALQILARDIHTDDGVANACLIEAADRLRELQAEVERRKDQLIEATTLLDKAKADKEFWFEKAKSENEAWLNAIAQLAKSRKALEDFLENKEVAK